MCGCNKHLKRRAKCTCVCPEHANFQAAYDLAMSRMDAIRDLRGRLEQALTAQPTISAEQVEAAARDLYEEEANDSGGFDSWPKWDSHDNATRQIWRFRVRSAFRAAGLTVAGESQ